MIIGLQYIDKIYFFIELNNIDKINMIIGL